MAGTDQSKTKQNISPREKQEGQDALDAIERAYEADEKRRLGTGLADGTDNRDDDAATRATRDLVQAELDRGDASNGADPDQKHED